MTDLRATLLFAATVAVIVAIFLLARPEPVTQQPAVPEWDEIPVDTCMNTCQVTRAA